MKKHVYSRAAAPSESPAGLPQSPSPPDPAIIWLFDSSHQLLVYRDTESGQVGAWPESFLQKTGWSCSPSGLRMLPRCQVQK